MSNNSISGSVLDAENIKSDRNGKIFLIPCGDYYITQGYTSWNGISGK